MMNRQRRTISIDVVPEQRATLERILGALPRATVETPLPPPSELPALFYHPNTAARVLALVLSAGYDIASGRVEAAEKKLERGQQVLTLASGEDAPGRRHLDELKRLATTDAAAYLAYIHEPTAGQLFRAMDNSGVQLPVGAAAMPRAVEEGTEIPEERRAARSGAARPPRTPRSRSTEVRSADAEVGDDSTAAIVAEVAASDEARAEHEHVAASRVTDDEAAAAAAAALAAIEAPYEDVVADDAKPRFDPDRDLEPDDARRNRRRRARGPEGLERPRPDQVREPRAEGGEAAPPPPPAERRERRDEPRRDEPRRDGPRRDEPRRDERRDEPRRDGPRRDEPRRDEPRRDEPRRDEPRRDEPRRDDFRRDEPRRDEPRREDFRRDEPRRDEPRRDEPRRDDYRRDEARRGPSAVGDTRISLSRVGLAPELAELALDLVRQALRMARETGMDGRIKVELNFTSAGASVAAPPALAAPVAVAPPAPLPPRQAPAAPRPAAAEAEADAEDTGSSSEESDPNRRRRRRRRRGGGGEG